MKTLAKSLGAVALVVVVAFAYLFLGTRLQVSVISESVVPASSYPEAYQRLLGEMESGTIGDRKFADLSGASIDDYRFVEIRVSARSFGLLPCEWITARVTPLEGDIALCQNDLPDIRALDRAEATVLVLARADAARTGHGVWIEYYAFGAHTYADAR